MVLDLLFSAGLVAVLRGVEPRKIHYVSSLALVKRLVVGAKLLQNSETSVLGILLRLSTLEVPLLDSIIPS
jgi:hypothetical protein